MEIERILPKLLLNVAQMIPSLCNLGISLITFFQCSLLNIRNLYCTSFGALVTWDISNAEVDLKLLIIARGLVGVVSGVYSLRNLVIMGAGSQTLTPSISHCNILHRFSRIPLGLPLLSLAFLRKLSTNKDIGLMLSTIATLLNLHASILSP
ncbi:hypothetical protein Cgig2_028464 [Carnegiea gigantea]|uniref:Uncharacterized protein n=1 Tax=Carnegiea gigantea TaxID=171969 RepID=A0A9Q1QE68_9CARY|nr:hypothetical protein Cgig2_028464 [Carnegiea gigantea]